MTALLVIGLVGTLLLVLSLVLGDVLDGLLDGAFDALPGDTFSTAVIGGFTAAFGFGGAAAESLGAPTLVSLGAGGAAGIAVGWFAARLTRLVRDGGSDATLESGDVLGRDGVVVSEVPAEGFGTVRVLVGGHVVRLNARAEGVLPAGTAVHVTAVLSPTAVVVAPSDPLSLPATPAADPDPPPY